jgi:hypothetical protein
MFVFFNQKKKEKDFGQCNYNHNIIMLQLHELNELILNFASSQMIMNFNKFLCKHKIWVFN